VSAATNSASRAVRGERRATNAAFGPRLNLLYVPALLVLIVFTFYPLVRGFAISLTDWNGYSAARQWVGIANYIRMLTDDNLRVSLLNTLFYGFGSTIIQQVIALLAALALNRKFRGRNFMRAIIYLPALISPVVMGTMYYLLFQYNNGALNDIVVALGGERVAWLASAGGARTVILIVNSLQFVGVSMIIYLAGLQGISRSYYEAASLDGASTVQQFWSITVPLLQPAFATSIVYNLIGGLKLYDVIKVMTNGGPGYSTNSLSSYISRTYFDGQNAGYASAQGVFLFVMIAVFTVILNNLLERGRVEEA